MKNWGRDKRGFTLIEIMIVVGIIGVLMLAVIPHSMRARQSAIVNSCLANMRQLSNTLERVATETGESVASLSEAEIAALVTPDHIKTMPDCRQGVYSTDEAGVVYCSVHSP